MTQEEHDRLEAADDKTLMNYVIEIRATKMVKRKEVHLRSLWYDGHPRLEEPPGCHALLGALMNEATEGTSELYDYELRVIDAHLYDIPKYPGIDVNQRFHIFVELMVEVRASNRAYGSSRVSLSGALPGGRESFTHYGTGERHAGTTYNCKPHVPSSCVAGNYPFS
jgi:hypothetical protein